jgi:hypothetical protein
MRCSSPVPHRFLALAILCIGPAAVGQAQAPSSVTSRKGNEKVWVAPRTAGNHPDLEGFWSNATLTPFERPLDLAGKEFFSEAEASAFEQRTRDAADRDRRLSNPQADVNQAYNEAWFDRGSTIFSTRRTSIVVDPPVGRVPPLTPQAQRDAADRVEVQRRDPTGPEDMALPVRCLLWPTAGPPMLPGPYNNNYQIVQTADAVVINVEMIHDVRIIPLNGRPHLSPRIRLWMGDPVGHWEGDTLVVDTTNFTDKTHVRGSDQNLHLIERFTLTGPDTLLYGFTIDNPTAFSRPWTGEIVMTRIKGPLYEYACHEANYSMANILRATRAAEKVASPR